MNSLENNDDQKLFSKATGQRAQNCSGMVGTVGGVYLICGITGNKDLTHF